MPDLLSDNKALMDALAVALYDPGRILPRAPREDIQSWQRRAVVKHAAPLIAEAERQRLLSVRLDRWGHTIATYSEPDRHPEDRWDRGYQCAMREVGTLLRGEEVPGGG